MTIPDDQTRQHRTAAEQRALARRLRAMVQHGKSVTQAAAAHKVSRAHYYRLVDALEAWDAQATRHEELIELEAQFKFKSKYDPLKWLFASGKMTLDYVGGDPELAAICGSAVDIVAADDSLLD
jgi:hypothetical protein